MIWVRSVSGGLGRVAGVLGSAERVLGARVRIGQASDAALAFDLAETELSALDALHSEQGSFLTALLPMLHTPQTVLV